MNKIFTGDALKSLKKLSDQCVQTCVTSPPYFGLRDYGMKGQMGLEETPEAYVQKMVELFREVRRVLRDDGTLWLNLGDSYGKEKQLLGIPWRVAFALQADGWYLRQDIIWSKPNPMPESVTDRCTKAHEYIFLLSRSPKYHFDHVAIKEPAAMNRWGGKKAMNLNNSKDKANVFSGLSRERDMMPETRNRRSVWTVITRPYKGAHFATFPQALIEPCILAGAPAGSIVLDPFMGSGTTAAVAVGNGRQYIGCELNPVYVKLAQERLRGVQLPLAA